MRNLAITLALTLLASDAHGAGERALYSTRGVVAADHRLASAAGAAMLKRGGNAVDAVCAAAFALSVVNPSGSGIGGGGFMLIKRPGNKPAVVVDFREVAPLAASREMFIKAGVPKNAPRYGGLAIGVPGEVAGCAHAVKKYGKLSLARVLAPAIRYASRGFRVEHHLAAGAAWRSKKIARYPELAKILLPGGKPLRLGQRLRRPRLARTLRAIARRGARVFYRGWIARDIVAAAKKAGGILSMADLAGYKVRERKPLHVRYRGRDVYTMPPPSSGGIAIVMALNMLRRRKLAALGHNSSRYLHLLTEVLKHAFADRARHLGDSDFVKVPVARLTAQSYADKLLARVGKHTLPINRYGSKGKKNASPRDSGTSHISVIDKAGMAVSMTSTINTGFGSLVVGKRSGIMLNNEMADFTTRPGKPNVFGLVQSEKNTVAPNKRPLSSMSPTIVSKDGAVELVVGASGGPTIITGTLQVLLNVIDFRLEPGEAVARSRVHHQWLPNKLWIEDDLPADVRAALRRRGHKLRAVKHPFTAVQAAAHRPGERHVAGACDPRKGGAPAAP